MNREKLSPWAPGGLHLQKHCILKSWIDSYLMNFKGVKWVFLSYFFVPNQSVSGDRNILASPLPLSFSGNSWKWLSREWEVIQLSVLDLPSFQVNLGNRKAFHRLLPPSGVHWKCSCFLNSRLGFFLELAWVVCLFVCLF